MLLLTLVTPATAAESKTEIYVANTNPEFVVGDPGNPSNSYTVEILLQGGQSGKIVVDFVDYVSGPQGRTTLPGGASPNSLKNAIYLATEQVDYIPNGTSQVFELKFLPLASMEPKLYSGGLRWVPSCWRRFRFLKLDCWGHQELGCHAIRRSCQS